MMDRIEQSQEEGEEEEETQQQRSSTSFVYVYKACGNTAAAQLNQLCVCVQGMHSFFPFGWVGGLASSSLERGRGEGGGRRGGGGRGGGGGREWWCPAFLLLPLLLLPSPLLFPLLGG